MAELAQLDILKKVTNLSDMQQKLLLTILELLPFAASLPQQEVYVYTTNKDGNIIYWSEENIDAKLDQYKEVQPFEMGLWQKVLHTGAPVKGYMERKLGHMERLVAFPIIDNGGRCIGGIAIIHAGLGHKESEEETKLADILAETTYMAMLVPMQQEPELYTPLSYRDGLIIFDDGGLILYANEAASRLVDLLGFDRRLLHTSVYGGSLKMSWVKQALQMHRGAIAEEIYGDIVLEQRVIPISIGNRKKRSMLILKDRTEYRRQEQALLVKNSVIKEIHHRVKNNLQVVAGLLRMEGRRSHNEEVKKALREGVSRIESMALVHELISHYDEDYIDLRTIGEELFRLLRLAMMRPHQKIEFIYEGPKIVVSSHRGSYISLILNELISNSLEHGFNILNEASPSEVTQTEVAQTKEYQIRSEINQIMDHYNLTEIVQTKEHQLPSYGATHFYIKIKASHILNKIQLIVEDNGCGFGPNFDVTTSSRLGLQIIKNLVENELNGTLLCKNSEGATVILEFPEEQ